MQLNVNDKKSNSQDLALSSLNGIEKCLKIKLSSLSYAFWYNIIYQGHCLEIGHKIEANTQTRIGGIN